MDAFVASDADPRPAGSPWNHSSRPKGSFSGRGRESCKGSCSVPRYCSVGTTESSDGDDCSSSAAGPSDMSPDATQPRVTVRPKPPVLLGATSATTRWPQTEIVSDNPRPGRTQRLQGSRCATPRTIFRRFLRPAPAPVPLRFSVPSLDPALRHSLGYLQFRLAASPSASLARPFRSSLGVRRASVSELRTGCASRHTRSMGIREIHLLSPPFCDSSTSAATSIPNLRTC
jgi:hypothetical protein